MPSSSAQHAHQSSSSSTFNDELFLDPMLGSPLNIYVEAEVPHRDQYVEAVTKHGGHVSPSYSSCLHIIVDPHSESGQSLYRQYAGKKTKLVLGYRWINECIQKNKLQLFAESWAGCKVTGKEQTHPRRVLEEQHHVERHHLQAGARRPGPQTPQETRPRVQTHSAVPQHPPTPQSVDRRHYSNAPQAHESQTTTGVPATEAAQRIGPSSYRGRQARHTQRQAIQHPLPSASSLPDSRPVLHHTQSHVVPHAASPPQQTQSLQQHHTPQTQFTQPSSIHPSQTRTQSQLLPIQTTPQLPSSAFSFQVFASAQPSESVVASTSASVQAVSQHTQHQQPWQAPTPVTPHSQSQNLQHLPSRSQHLYNREPTTTTTTTTWSDHSPQFSQLQSQPSLEDIQPAYYDDQYPDDSWSEAPAHSDYYENRQDAYDSQTTAYQSETYASVAAPSTSSLQHAIQPQPTVASSSDSMGGHDQSRITSPSVPPVTSMHERRSPSPDEPRGRKRTRTLREPPKTLVVNRGAPPLSSPTPPTRIVKSTYGGNLFTADDVEYLKRYIAYCQSQGLVLSLREICERIAVKAPHHTFYSWRRYCNKHQIRLGGYMLGTETRSPTPADGNHSHDDAQVTGGDPEDADNSMGVETGVFNAMIMAGEGPFTLDKAERMYNEQRIAYRSPSPPKALFRSTTGKGVAFTADDVSFLCKYLAYRKTQGQVDMVAFWKDVAAKAPHHSRASWMKYYRRHKHEIYRVDGDAPLPPPPEKKMRYGREDDILLARHFANKPEGTSDKVFQAFAQLYPHHPWKGWQEHYRIHKAKIDHILQEEVVSVQGTPIVSATPQLNGAGDAGVYQPI